MGGTNDGISQSFNSKDNSFLLNINYAAWQSSVTEANAGIIEIDWEHTYSICDFVADPVRKAELKKAVENHLSKKTIKMVEVKPLYRLYSLSANNTFFSTSLNEVQEYIGWHKYVLDYGDSGFRQDSYVQGYVFKTQQPGTVPLYRLWDGISNTFFTSSLSEAKYYINTHKYRYDYGSVNNYIMGYVYQNNPGPVYKPIYRLYQSNWHNTFMTTSHAEGMYYISNFSYTWDNGRTHYIQGYLLRRE